MKAARILRQKIAEKRPTIGVIVIDHLWQGLVEICMNAGADFMILDGEHADHGGVALSNAFAMGRTLDFPMLYRPGRTDAAGIRLALDLGPCGLMLPMIDRPAQLDEVRDAIYMPPRGRRRPGGAGNRWPKSFQYADWKQDVEDDLLILPQIESPEGVENAESIARHEVTTHLASGPYDLSARLGVCWDPEAPALVAALSRAHDAARRCGKTLMTVGPAALIRRLGLHFYVVAEPSSLLEAKLKELVAESRKGVGS